MASFALGEHSSPHAHAPMGAAWHGRPLSFLPAVSCTAAAVAVTAARHRPGAFSIAVTLAHMAVRDCQPDDIPHAAYMHHQAAGGDGARVSASGRRVACTGPLPAAPQQPSARCAAHLSTRSTARSSASESCQSDRAFWASAAFTAPLKFSPDLAAISIATADNPSSTPASHGRAHRHRKPLPRALACWHSRAVCSEGPEPRAAPGMAARRRWRR